MLWVEGNQKKTTQTWLSKMAYFVQLANLQCRDFVTFPINQQPSNTNMNVPVTNIQNYNNNKYIYAVEQPYCLAAQLSEMDMGC